MDVFISDHTWPDILKYVNPQALLKLRRICKNLRSIIEEIFEKNNLWKDLCMNSNIKPWIWNIREKLFPYEEEYTSEGLDYIWRDIFYSYRYWRGYSKRTSKYSYFDLPSNSVTFRRIKCTDAYDRHFAIACDSGVVFLFVIDDRYDFSKCVRIFRTYTGHRNEIYRQVQFCHTGETTFLALSTHLGNLTIIDIFKNRVYNDLLINAFTRSQTLRRGTDHKLNIGSAINVFYQLLWKDTPDTIDITPKSIEDKYNDLWWPIKSICNQYEKTTIVIKYQSSIIIKYYDNNSINTKNCGNYFRLFPENFYIPIPEIVFINKGVNLVAAVLDDSKKFRVKHHYLMGCLDGKIVSIVMHVNLLFLGTSSGSVRLFMLKDIQQLVNEDLSTLPMAKILLNSSEPILALEITQVNKVPYIIAFTRSKLHIIKL